MPVHIVISGGANELVGEIVFKALENAGISANSWSNCASEDLEENIQRAIADDHQVVVSAMADE